MPFRTASTLTFFYALGYPIGALAVSSMSPMAVLVFRFGLAAAIPTSWALLAHVTWPTGRTLVHVLASGLLAQGLLFACLLSRLAACVGPEIVLVVFMPLTVTDPWKAVGAVAAVVLLNATLCMTLYVRAINNLGPRRSRCCLR